MEREHKHDGGAIRRLPNDYKNGVHARNEVGANAVPELPMFDGR